MRATASLVSADEVLWLRVRYRDEMRCQIVHDSIHRRAGWTDSYALGVDGVVVGFGTVAIGGPWTGKPTILEFYLLPEHRHHAFRLFESFRAACGAGLMEVQSNEPLPGVMMHAYAHEVRSESIVFQDGVTTRLEANGVTLEQTTSEEEIRAAIGARQGGGEWQLRLDSQTVATGGILFHYNVPYGDIYMDVAAPFRRRGFGSYLVQELKRLAYERGAIPAARCNPANLVSRATLQKAGFVPYAHILTGVLRTE
jgi:GNAT superfamily N-acetyltransferase